MKQDQTLLWTYVAGVIFNLWTINMQNSNIQEWNMFKLQNTHKLHNLIYSRWCRRNNVLVQHSKIYYQMCNKK